jgi:lipopolysaccharide biosynthesis regulator YciM
VQAGIAEARRALNEIPNDARAMLNMGQCLISTQPPQRAEALELWQRVIETTPADSPLAIQAQRLITLYQQ